MISNKEYTIPQIRLSYVSDCDVEHPQVIVSGDIVDFLRETYDDGEIDFRESFKVVYLNRSNKILGFQTVSEGGTALTVVDMKMIFAGALLSNASFIILCHNHPSGNMLPSPQDDSLTRKARTAGEALEIKVIDHVILTRNGYYSYNDEGKL